MLTQNGRVKTLKNTYLDDLFLKSFSTSLRKRQACAASRSSRRVHGKEVVDMSKATEGKLPSGAHASKARSNYPGQETETRADGLQNRLKEKVREVKYDQK